MSDIAKAFTFLQDTIPQWLQDITNIDEKVTRMQDDIARLPASQSPFVKRTGSLESVRPGRLDAVAEETTPSSNAQTNPLGSRKRKSPSTTSGHVSGPTKYRPRTMVIVSYDGDMQKSFELLVRGLATGRNMLRKAKMEARMAEMAAIAGSSDDDDDDDAEEETILSKISFQPRMAAMRVHALGARSGGRAGLNGGPAPSMELFESTDKTLEQAQELCEKSAHLILRDGDCRTELKLVRTHFDAVLSTARTEVTKRAASQPQPTQIPQGQDVPETSVSSKEPSYKRHFPNISTPKPSPVPEAKAEPAATHLSIHAPLVPTITAPKTMDIEVDDDDEDEDVDFVMPPVRFTSRRAARA